MDCDEVVLSVHAAQRMFERGLGVDDVLHALRHGEVVEAYLDDRPFPSCLLLAEVGGRPVHVVAARDERERRCYVITAYVPDPDLWDSGFRARRVR